ncbi:predicted protein [Postia placenta Mad-698-R]|uniref:Uncharacterized protein n=1 Tax=Postia placenta MAD-698-R-SB12 TaxID=670580 RepID=A0A1X6MPL4_9APHY|nr:hypothetical protein POSPLADRAFT_1154414 [Postia placenta MAD-698-R-SB12]EED85278.1 predicted protein [Postia placenta Mad-698-R]OSX58315.1 hypothetical protein POSPLADRAFT_1154414 [Postia placenta MAD-698-R-SB12]
MDPALMEAIATANWVEGGESDNLSIFNTDSVTAADKTSTIKRVHLACTGTLDNVRGIYSYHWRLFFQLTPVEANLVEKRSVELHVTLLNKGTGMANTIAMSRNYENTHRSVATTYWDVVDDEWTRERLRVLVHSGLGGYRGRGKFSSGVKKAAEEFVNEAARERGMPVPPPRGIFYD